MKILFFTDKDEKMLILTQAESDLGIHIDNEETTMESVRINEGDGYLTNKDGYITISWASNGMIFSLDGEEESEEMLAIAKEIKNVLE